MQEDDKYAKCNSEMNFKSRKDRESQNNQTGVIQKRVIRQFM